LLLDAKGSEHAAVWRVGRIRQAYQVAFLEYRLEDGGLIARSDEDIVPALEELAMTRGV
jgi:hypothetical protein